MATTDTITIRFFEASGIADNGEPYENVRHATLAPAMTRAEELSRDCNGRADVYCSLSDDDMDDLHVARFDCGTLAWAAWTGEADLLATIARWNAEIATERATEGK